MPASSQPQSPDPPDVTALLLAWAGGDRAALDALLPALYADLHAQAARALRREATGHSLQPTALVHEAYLRLVDQGRVPVESRSQFYGIAARVMRQILVDHARTRSAAKRGGAVQPVTLTDSAAATELPAVEILAVHEALERLELLDPQQARLVELRYFAGLTIDRYGRRARDITRHGQTRLGRCERVAPAGARGVRARRADAGRLRCR